MIDCLAILPQQEEVDDQIETEEDDEEVGDEEDEMDKKRGGIAEGDGSGFFIEI